MVPESLGNKQIILPRGVVCDQCNNGILSQLDSSLLSSQLIGFYRTWLKIPNKTGQLSDTNYMNGIKMGHTKTGISMNVPDFSERHFKAEPQADGTVSIKMTLSAAHTPTASKKMARALYKIGLGLIYLQDKDVALSKRYDEVRAIILGNKSFSGYLLVRSVAPPNPQSEMSFRYVNLLGKTHVAIFQLNFFGLEFAFDFEIRDIPIGNKLKGVTLLTW